MRTPTIHLNGTGADTLIREAQEALSKLSEAREAVCNITVHGRDFYPQDRNTTDFHAIQDARKQFNELIARLDSISKEITSYTIEIIDGGARSG